MTASVRARWSSWPTVLPCPSSKLWSRADLKGSGVRGQTGLSEDRATVPEGPSGQAVRQTAAGTARASSRGSIWGGLRARVLTLEPPLHPLSLSQQPLPAPLWERSQSDPLSSVLASRLHSAFPPPSLSFLLAMNSIICASGPSLGVLAMLTHALPREPGLSLPPSSPLGLFHGPLPPHLEPKP